MQNHSFLVCNVSFYIMLKHAILWIFKVLKEQSDVVWCQLARSWQILSSYQWGPPHSERETGSPLNNISFFHSKLKINCLEEFKVISPACIDSILDDVLFMAEFTYKSCLFSVVQLISKFWSWNEMIPKSHGLRSESIRMSYPYSSKQLFLTHGSTPRSAFNPFQLSPTLGKTYFLNIVSLPFM